MLARITKDGRRVARKATKSLNNTGFGMSPPLRSEVCEILYAALGPLRVAAGDFAAAPE